MTAVGSNRARAWTAVLALAAASYGCGAAPPDERTPSATASPAVSGAPAAQPPLDPVEKVQAWRDKHEVDYIRDWVSIDGLHMLPDGVLTVGSDPASAVVIQGLPPLAGRLTVKAGEVRFDAAAGVVVTQKGAPVSGAVVLKAAGTPPGPEIVLGSVRLVVHESGSRLGLRVRDSDGAMARAFLGFTWFPIQSAYRVTGRFIRDAEPRRLKVLNTFDDIDEYATEGVVEFELQGRTLRLRPFTTRPKRFYFVFRDASAGVETYKVARFLYADLADDGTAVLDFNEAYNPPCAFNPYTTCPIPVVENRLPIKILAGEKAYPVEVKLPGGS